MKCRKIWTEERGLEAWKEDEKWNGKCGCESGILGEKRKIWANKWRDPAFSLSILSFLTLSVEIFRFSPPQQRHRVIAATFHKNSNVFVWTGSQLHRLPFKSSPEVMQKYSNCLLLTLKDSFSKGLSVQTPIIIVDSACYFANVYCWVDFTHVFFIKYS